MLKIAVFDSGLGGEIFADTLAEELPVTEVIRVIDWRHADEINRSPHRARKYAELALRPYIGTVDLIILANQLLTLTSLKYFRRQYPNQEFIGLDLEPPNTTRPTLILTTSATSRTLSFRMFMFKLRQPTAVLCLDNWPALIDSGQLDGESVRHAVVCGTAPTNFKPAEAVLACAHFNDTIPDLKRVCGGNLGIRNGFHKTIEEACRVLKLRGGTGRKKK